MPKAKKERLLCAAIWYDDGQKHYYQPINIDSGFVVSGHRHGSIMHAMAGANGQLRQKNERCQGFLTTKNRFLNRREAREFAISTGQLTKTMSNDELYSEDLY